MPQLPDLPEVMTVAEVAEAFRVSDETVHRMTRKGELIPIKAPGAKRYRRDYIAGLLEQRDQTAAEQVAS